ncbi:cadherin-related family member 3 isoform X5 [Phyllostomus discolor]|uniref:Cadherin-related family member 3 isoform X5 n=1 Tax=Phyllostomus discolor TaxID=89673 RepID=A0A7E6CKA4_9CHIR|nr:cadherin-related family member 3 isoform X5 [Phyllostomus discolor]
MQEAVLLLILLSAMSGGEALYLIHLPATSNVTENSPPETSVHTFSVHLSASLSPVIPGFPMIINSSPLTEVFRVKWLSGTNFEVVTTEKEQLDFETGPNIFDLQIYVKDDAGFMDLQVLTVQVTDVNEPPQFLGNLAKGLDLYIVEGIKPRFIYQVEAFDPEDTRRNIPLRYFLIPPSNNFSMSANGILFSTTEFDFEEGHNSYRLIVEVRDSQGLTASTTLQVNIVNINDEIPRFTSIMVPENTAKRTLLLDLNSVCFDDDSEAPNSQFNFTTPSAVGSHGRFLQDPAGSGKIVLIGDLDYENPSNLAASNKYMVRIQVQDVAHPYYKNNIYIYVLTNPENEFPLIFDQPSYVFNVSEIRPAGTQFGRVQATDQDLPQSSIVYSISAGGAGLQYTNMFWINPQTGELKLVTKVDYETTPTYTLRIQATNNEDTNSVTVTVNILEKNDEKPVCIPNSYFLAIPVDLKVGTNIQNFKLVCTDRDSSPRSFRYSIGSGNVNSHFTFSPNAGSNVTQLLLATRFDYTGGLDKIWDYRLLVYITDDNLLSGRKKADTLVETGTVTLSISVISHPTTIVTTTSRPRITHQILRKNAYSPSAWYVPFVITFGSILLLIFLVTLMVQLANAIHRHCPCKTRKHKTPLVKKGEMKNTKREVVVETIQMSTVFDGEAIDPVTGAKYEFNSKTGARKWKDPFMQMSKWKESSPEGTTPNRAVSAEEIGLPGSTDKEGNELSGTAQAESAGPGSRNQDGKPGTQKKRDAVLTSRPYPSHTQESKQCLLLGLMEEHKRGTLIV